MSVLILVQSVVERGGLVEAVRARLGSEHLGLLFSCEEYEMAVLVAHHFAQFGKVGSHEVDSVCLANVRLHQKIG